MHAGAGAAKKGSDRCYWITGLPHDQSTQLLSYTKHPYDTTRTPLKQNY